MNVRLRIEQLAFAPADVKAAERLLKKLGLTEWVFDEVVAKGEVDGEPAENRAHLRFNYTAFEGKELELLDYVEGDNWFAPPPGQPKQSLVSHVGFHCSEDELSVWRDVMREEGIPVVQEVFTQSHTNPVIKDTRRYHYVIFGTREILGTDLKLICRRNPDTPTTNV